MEQKKTYFVIILFLTILSINLISAVTLNSGKISSSGLNSTITITFSLTFDLLNVSNNSITFYNLTYVHPSSCGQSSSYSVYNYTNSSQNITLDQLLPSISCPPAAAVPSTGNQPGSSQPSSSEVLTQSNWQVTLTPGSVSVLNFSSVSLGNSSLSLSEMDISVSQAQNTNVLVNQYSNIPSGIPPIISGQIYQYLQISFSNPAQILPVLQNTNLIFKVNKSWISSNNINPNNISIYKLDNATNNKWVILPTTYNNSDANFYYYQASVNSFSYFAIGASIINTQQNQTPSPLSKNKNSTLLILIIIVVLIIGALILVIIKRKKDIDLGVFHKF